MMPPPTTAGLFLCRRIEFYPSTQAVSLGDVYWRTDMAAIPGTADPFYVFAALRGGWGDGMIQVAAYRLDTYDLVYATARPIRFLNRLGVVYVTLQISHCRFPVPGEYEFVLLVDHEIIAQQKLDVIRKGDQT